MIEHLPGYSKAVRTAFVGVACFHPPPALSFISGDGVEPYFKTGFIDQLQVLLSMFGALKAEI